MTQSPSELRLFASLLRPYRAAFAAAVAVLVLESALALSLPWFAGRVAEALLAAQLPTALLSAWLGVLVIQALLAFANASVLGVLSARLAADLGQRVYEHLQVLPSAWHHRRRRGELIALMTSDVSRLSDFLAGVFAPLLPALLTCVGSLVLLVLIQPWIGLAIAMAVPAFVIAVRLLTRRMHPLASEYAREDAAKYGLIEQNLGALSLIRAFTREAAESERFRVQAGKVRDLEIQQMRIAAILGPAVRLFAALGVLLLVWLAGAQVAGGQMSAGDLVSLLLYGMLLVSPASLLAGTYGQLESARGAASRLLEALDEAPEPDPGEKTLASVRGDIEFRAVGFAYPQRNPVFKSLDLVIRAGETVAITGPNGAGKSTLANLLLRFYEPQSGQVSLDGVDLRELRLTNLRSHIGLVSQQVLLINDTVANNIGFGRYGAARADIEAAAKSAHAHDFIEKLPDGYDTLIGDDGIRLSGGQRQRLALARALLKDPAILVLDEATAMFDPEAEREFIAECHELLRNRTVILITHRPASLALADRVLRLEEGRISLATGKA